MKVQPRWWVSLIPYVIYNLIMYGTWAAVGADYNDLVSRGVVFKSLVLPLGFGFVFLVVILTRLGWWEAVMRDEHPASPRWLLWPIVLVMAAMILLNLSTTDWSAIAAGHLLLLLGGSVLVGFNEEALTRGILVVAMRGTTRSETRIWLWSSVLFGLLHLPNAFFGIGLFAGAVQTIFAILAGSGFYVLRRSTAWLVPAMVFHGLWDFSALVHLASGAKNPALHTLIQLSTYGISLVCAVWLVWAAGRRARRRA